MIARIWKGAVRRDDGDAYAAYVRETGVAGYSSTPGNRGVWMLRRDVGENTEFVMFTLWDSVDAVKAFAGADYETAVFYPEDDRYLVERDCTATHYLVDSEIRDQSCCRASEESRPRPRNAVGTSMPRRPRANPPPRTSPS